MIFVKYGLMTKFAERLRDARAIEPRLTPKRPPLGTGDLLVQGG